MRAAPLLLLAACSAHEPPPTAPVQVAPIPSAPVASTAKPPPDKERILLAHIARVLDQAAALRGLPAKRPVAGAVLSRAELLAQLKKHVQKEVPPAAIVREGNALKLAGALDPAIDYESVMYRLLEEQLAGFYSPEDETMSLAGDLDEDMADATLIHELIHALQDQYFDLKPGSKYHPGQSDKSFAHSAMAEGDATSAMTDFMLGSSNKQGVPSAETEATMMVAMQSAMPDFAPAILQRSLVAPYVTGLRFVNAQRRKGGWEAVNAAWKNPPLTSEQVLHDDKYERHEAELVVPAPLAQSLGASWKVDEEDTSGELGLLLVYETWFGRRRAAELAQGWGGDRSSMLHDDGGAIALLDHVRYDEPARPQAAKLADAIGKQWGATASSRAGVVAYCKERPKLGPAVVVARSSAKAGDVVLGFGPADAKDFASKGTCATALKAALAELDR